MIATLQSLGAEVIGPPQMLVVLVVAVGVAVRVSVGDTLTVGVRVVVLVAVTVAVTVGVNVAVTIGVIVGVDVGGRGAPQPYKLLSTARTSSSTVTRPLPLPSARGQADSGC